MSSPPPQRLARGLAFQGGSQIAQSAITLALMPLIIKLADVAVYGSYVVITALITLTVALLSLGAGFKCRRALPSATESSARAAAFLPSASFQFCSATVSALVLILVLPGLNHAFFHGAIAVRPTTVLLAVYSLYFNNLADDYFRYTHQIPLISKAIIARSALHPALVLAYAVLGHPLHADALIALQATAFLAVSGFLWWQMSRELPLAFRLESWAAHRADIRLGFPLITAVVVENLLAAADRFILAAYLSPAAVGAYAAAFTVGSLVLLLPRTANSALLPALTQAVDTGRTTEAQRMLQGFLQVYSMLSLPFIVGGVMLGRPVLSWIANPDVAATGHWVVPIVAMGCTLYGYCYLMFNALFVNQQTALWFKANLAAAAVSITLNLVLVGWFRRIEAAAVVSMLSYGLSFFIIQRSTDGWKMSLNRGLLGKSAVATTGMALGLWGALQLPFFSSTDTLRLLLLTGMGGSLYFVLLAVLGGFTPSQFRQALGL